MNRTPLLARSLTRLSELTWPDEILIVDDGGSDGCEAICDHLRGSLGLPIRYLYTHNPGNTMAAHARNCGLRNTDCEWIVSSEPEIYFESHCVAQFLAYHEQYPKDMLNAGTVYHEHPDWNPPQVTTTENWQATWTCFYGKQWMLDVGGYDENFPQPWSWDDVDMGTRLMASGHGQRNPLDIVIRHQWHPHRGHDQTANENYFRAKMSGDHCMEVVANAGREWGVPKLRP